MAQAPDATKVTPPKTDTPVPEKGGLSARTKKHLRKTLSALGIVALVGVMLFVPTVWSTVTDGVWTVRQNIARTISGGPDNPFPGVLSVEPPQLYTRERLVNDRFRQANWLERQLQNTDPKSLGITPSTTRSSQAYNDLEMAMAVGPKGAAATTPASAKKETPPLPSPADAPTPVSVQQALIQADKLRQRLRTDLMDTLLDDGHDLQGNTLYRLNFDAVVMPFQNEANRRRYPGTAVFTFEASNPYAAVDACQPALETGAEPPGCAAYFPKLDQIVRRTVLEAVQSMAPSPDQSGNDTDLASCDAELMSDTCSKALIESSRALPVSIYASPFGLHHIAAKHASCQADTADANTAECTQYLLHDSARTLRQNKIQQLAMQRVAEDVELLRDWQREIQQFLTRVLQTRIEAFRETGRLENPVDPKENIALDWFLRSELIDAFLSGVIYDPDVAALCAAVERSAIAKQDATQATETSLTSSPARFDCRIWIANAIGLAWTPELKSPDIKPDHALAGVNAAGFRKSIRHAHHISAVRELETLRIFRGLLATQQGKGTSQRPQPAPPQQPPLAVTNASQQPPSKESDPKPAKPTPSAQNAQPRKPSGPPKGQGNARQNNRNAGISLKDEDSKRALIRLITVWRTMEIWGQQTGLAADATSQSTEQIANAFSANASPEEKERQLTIQLLQALGKYDTELPDQQDVQRLSQDLETSITEAFKLGGPQALVLPNLENAPDRCLKELGKTPDQVDRYTCAFLHVQTQEASANLISNFLLTRLQEDIDVYDTEDRSIRDFLMVKLAGCETTGCRIQVSQHAALPGSELLGGRAAGHAPPRQTTREMYLDALTDWPETSFQTKETLASVLNEGRAVLGSLRLNLGIDNTRTTAEIHQRIARDIAKLAQAHPHSPPSPAWSKSRIEQLIKAGNVDIDSLRKAIGAGVMRLDETGIFLADALMRDLHEVIAQQEDGQQRPVKKRLAQSIGCLSLARTYSETEEGRVEAYLACMLRNWVNKERSDVVVYAVNPRAGDGDDLEHISDLTRDRLAAGISSSANARAEIQLAEALISVLENPGIIGFSHMPGSETSWAEAHLPHQDTATFGWAIRPRPLGSGDGYVASHHRLSAVLSLPSWWKRAAFEVRGCWVNPNQVATNSLTAQDGQLDFRRLCQTDDSTGAQIGVGMIQRRFEIKLPRRVEEVTSRFNFDFIKAPYYDASFDANTRQHPSLLSLEAGRTGQLVLQGERLWRGTVVTMNGQTANSIVVLPDMKGVIAEFECVAPPDGAYHVKMRDAQNGQPTRPAGQNAPLFVWTSEGGTTMKQVTIHPFIERWEGDRPCWMESP